MPKNASSMHSVFHDEDESTSYDKTIADTRRRMKTCSPCQSEREINLLIALLKQQRHEYRPRPCAEGYCFGLFTPHRSRIDRRITAFTNEREIHESDCHDYLREAKHEEERQRHKEEMQQIMEIETQKIASHERISNREIEAKEKAQITENHTVTKNGMTGSLR